jgi:hypothetical protein
MIDSNKHRNRIELFMIFAVSIISLISTGIIFPLIISTDKLPLSIIIVIFCFFLLMIFLFIREVFDFFYKKWEIKNGNQKKQ